MFTIEQIKSEALKLMAWRGDEAPLSAMRRIEEFRQSGDKENEENWQMILDRIRRYEYPIDYTRQ